MITLLLALSLQAQEPGKRLIEKADGSRHWMTQDQITALSEEYHAKGYCGGFFDITDFPDPPVATHQTFLNPALIESPFATRPLTEQETVNRLLGMTSEADRVTNLRATVTHLSTQYPHRKHHTDEGRQAALWIEDQLRTIGSRRNDVEVERFDHDWEQPTIIARIRGTKFPDERVVLGGHADSISGLFETTAPGADDNASGVAVLIETFRTLVESGYQPLRTIEIMAYAGEERGLLGSQAVATHYREKGISVVGVIQFDMTMFASTLDSLSIITDHTDPGLNELIKKLLDEYVKIPWTTSQCGYPCSDHASWMRNGYPAAFTFESIFGTHNPKIHTSNDRVEFISPEHGLHFTKLGVAFAIELGSGS